MGFMSTPDIPDAEPAVTTATSDDAYNTEQVYNAKASKRKGLLSTILAKSSGSSSGNSAAAAGKSSTLG